MVPCTDNGVDGGLRSTTAISFFIRMQFTRDCARRPRPTESSLHVLDLANISQRYRREPRMILLAQGHEVPHRSTTALASSRHGTSRSRGRSPINLAREISADSVRRSSPSDGYSGHLRNASSPSRRAASVTEEARRDQPCASRQRVATRGGCLSLHAAACRPGRLVRRPQCGPRACALA